jgi:glycosyltransferase involved in cell wall biosynthesis
MKIMLVLANGGGGGMQRQVVLLANGLSACGHGVVVVVGGGEAVDGLASSEVQLIRLPEFRGRSGGLQFTRGLRQLVRRLRPDVVHGHGLRLAISLRLARRRATRVLVTSHGIDPVVVAKLRWPLRLARVRVMACGEAPQHLLASIGISSTIVPVGIETPPESKTPNELRERFQLPDGARIAVSAIRLSEQKDPETMIRAVAKVNDLHLVLFGDGPLLEPTRILATSLGAAERIHFVGYDREVRSWMPASEVVVLSSIWEGHVLVALEAMAAGVPLVATACPGIAEWVEHEHAALLSPVRDAEALAENLRRVLSSRDLAQRLIAQGAELAMRHGAQGMVEAHLDVYGVSA